MINGFCFSLFRKFTKQKALWDFWKEDKIMKINRVLNIEDTMSKHVAVRRALGKCGVADNIIDHATTAMEGLAMIDVAIEEGKPYSVLVLDMFFPIFPGERMSEAGMYVLKELREKEIAIPIIVCSSVQYCLPGVVGCIRYNEWKGDLDGDMREMIERVRNEYPDN